MKNRHSDSWIALGVGVLTLIVYLATLCPVIYWGDSAEFAVICPLLDIAHPTGYPLFTLLGKLFSYLPVGTVAMRINLLAAVAGSTACGFAFLIARQIGFAALPAVMTALLLAVSRELWEQSSAAEVYSLHLALTAAVLWASLRYSAEPSRRSLIVTAALLSLSFTNHVTTLWTIPAVLWFVLRPILANRKQRAAESACWSPRRADWVATGLTFTAGMSLYLYLPLRSLTGPLFNHGQLSSPSNLIGHLSGRQFRYRMFADTKISFENELAHFFVQLQEQLTWWVLPLVAIGLFSLWRRDRNSMTGIGLLAGAHLLFAVNFYIPDKAGYFLPIYLVAALLTGEGVRALSRRIPSASVGNIVTAGLLGALIFWAGRANHAIIDKSDNRSLPDYTAALLDPLSTDALVLSDNQDLLWSANYPQLIEGAKAGPMVVSDYWICLPWYVNHLRRRFPALIVPETIDELVAKRATDIAKASGRQVGQISKSASIKISVELARANLGQRRVFIAFADFDQRTEWEGLTLLDRGLCYEIFASEAPAPEPWALDYPDPSDYPAQKLTEARHKFAASSFATASNRCGIVHINLQQYEKAKEAFLLALAYDPNYAQAHLNLGLVYHQYLPDPDRRNHHWSKVLQLDPNHSQADSIRKTIER